MAAHPRVLMLVPSVAKREIDVAVQADQHPTMDYYALQTALNADLLDYSALEAEASPALVRLARRAGKDAALAALGYLRRRDYDVIYSNGENISIPLAVLLKRHVRRPAHVLIGHRVSPAKKRPLLRALHGQMDAIFLYASPQLSYAEKELGFPKAKLHLIPFHADHRFYRPATTNESNGNESNQSALNGNNSESDSTTASASKPMICSAGLEWRDYPTLIEAVKNIDVEVRLAAASPWSKHRNETENRALPPNVSARRYEYRELRQLYAAAKFVVVPLYENDFQAGITTILEGMAMGKAIITSRTEGQVDTIRDGSNGIYVPPGDPAALTIAIRRLLDTPEEAQRLGAQARRDIEAGLTLEHWVERIARVIRDLHAQRRQQAA